MHEKLKSNLVKDFIESVKPNELSTSVKFKVQDHLIFEINISSNNTNELNRQVIDVIQFSISSAIKSLSSVK
ncbi:hypothetical protein B9T31_04005 [Acinetobacter sp. ANC 4558]|nr:hypothetical protein B9T31_04005 [Acinetobacter sp. ANC 4558]